MKQRLKLTALRCDTCAHLKDGFCSKIGEPLPNPLAKLFFGGADKLFLGTQTYTSECGIENEQRLKIEANVEVLTVENVFQKLPQSKHM